METAVTRADGILSERRRASAGKLAAVECRAPARASGRAVAVQHRRGLSRCPGTADAGGVAETSRPAAGEHAGAIPACHSIRPGDRRTPGPVVSDRRGTPARPAPGPAALGLAPGLLLLLGN